jgi:very-short-patch-repair endonuclease
LDPDTFTLVEYDGEVHKKEEQRRKDIARRRRIEQFGCQVLVAAAKDLYNPDSLIAAVRRAQESQARLAQIGSASTRPIIVPYQAPRP